MNAHWMPLRYVHPIPTAVYNLTPQASPFMQSSYYQTPTYTYTCQPSFADGWRIYENYCGGKSNHPIPPRQGSHFYSVNGGLDGSGMGRKVVDKTFQQKTPKTKRIHPKVNDSTCTDSKYVIRPRFKPFPARISRSSSSRSYPTNYKNQSNRSHGQSNASTKIPRSHVVCDVTSTNISRKRTDGTSNGSCPDLREKLGAGSRSITIIDDPEPNIEFY